MSNAYIAMALTVATSLSSPGVSREARLIQEALNTTPINVHDNSASNEPIRQALLELQEIAEEAQFHDWDGYGGQPVQVTCYYHAQYFLRTAAISLPLPEMSAEPDGEISFDWSNNNDDIFSVSVGPTGKLNYAGVIGAARVHGSVPFSDIIPDVIVFHIKQLQAQGYPYTTQNR